jgi:hypothetical protein
MQGVGRADVLLSFKCPKTKQMRCPVNAYQFQASGAAGFEVEGRLLYGAEGVYVGHCLKVELIRTDVAKGYIDFKKAPIGK